MMAMLQNVDLLFSSPSGEVNSVRSDETLAALLQEFPHRHGSLRHVSTGEDTFRGTLFMYRLILISGRNMRRFRAEGDGVY